MRAGSERRRAFEILAALIARRPVPGAVDWSSETLWQNLVPMAEMHRVTASLPTALHAAEAWDQLPPDVAEFLQAVKTLNEDRNQGLVRHCLSLIAILKDNNIRAVPLKGLAYQLLGLYADDPGQRMTVDIDLLVPFQDADRAQALLISDGYTPLSDVDVSKQEHHNHPRLKPDPDRHGPGSIEIHFRVGRNDTDQMLPAKSVLSSARPIIVDGLEVFLPSLENLLDHAVMHSGIAHSYASRKTTRLRDVVDIHRLWTIARNEGAKISDLRVAEHKLAGRYLGACLLLHGHDADALGPLEAASAKLLTQILRRQAIAERTKLETALLANARLVRQNPAKLLGKVLSSRFYRSAKLLTKSPTV